MIVGKLEKLITFFSKTLTCTTAALVQNNLKKKYLQKQHRLKSSKNAKIC